ncbi:hypothetical protein LTR95_002510 [Oleoguttula sp. CCFEE 5521]
MVHADSSNFAAGVTKEDAYQQVIEQAKTLLEDQRNWVACQTIAFGRGVCGAAAASGKTQLVPDVEAFPGHIACDSESKSEIVVPIPQGNKVVAIIDIDCAVQSGFDAVDQQYLEEFAALLAEACDW